MSGQKKYLKLDPKKHSGFIIEVDGKQIRFDISEWIAL